VSQNLQIPSHVLSFGDSQLHVVCQTPIAVRVDVSKFVRHLLLVVLHADGAAGHWHESGVPLVVVVDRHNPLDMRLGNERETARSMQDTGTHKPVPLKVVDGLFATSFVDKKIAVHRFDLATTGLSCRFIRVVLRNHCGCCCCGDCCC
jgi:hypothetical protein